MIRTRLLRPALPVLLSLTAASAVLAPAVAAGPVPGPADEAPPPTTEVPQAPPTTEVPQAPPTTEVPEAPPDGAPIEAGGYEAALPETDGREATPLEAGGQNEDANWVPFLGNHELWCTRGNPGYPACARHHSYPALDIGMPVGTRIYSAGPGRVTAARSAGDSRGIYVDIRHDDGIHSRYLHLSVELVNVGQQVERGTLIGRSGRSGRVSSPHLHYEERTAAGNLKDPGAMYGVVGGRLLAYPNTSGRTSWWSTPYGTRIRNQGFNVDNTTLYWGGPGVATGDLNGDGVADLVVGAPGEDTTDPPSAEVRVTHVDSGGAFVLYGSGSGVTDAGAERVLQEFNGVPGVMKSNEVAGAAVATGDFDDDGFDDVAIGAPAATVSRARAAGEVIVVHGSAEGLLPNPRGLRLIGVVPEGGDQFGASLTTGDFDGDGFDDLAVGAPGEGVGRRPAAGAVTVFGGSASGLGSTGREISSAPAAVAGNHERGDRLGVSLAAGDTNGDGIDDLAVGIPGEDAPDIGYPVNADGGAVLVLRGRPTTWRRSGLRGDGSVELHLDSAGVAGDGRAHDQLGISIAVGDVHGDGYADVVAGAIGKDVGRARDAGSLLVLRGSARGIRPRGSRHLTAASADVAGRAQSGDHLGAGLALSDLDDDGDADLVAGIVGQVVRRSRDAGAVLVLRGGLDGLTGAGSRQYHAASAANGLADQAEVDDALGASVAIGDFDGNRYGDLVVGVPGEDLPGALDTGSVVVVAGVGARLESSASQAFDGNSFPPGPPRSSRAEPGDRWGGLFPIFLR